MYKGPVSAFSILIFVSIWLPNAEKGIQFPCEFVYFFLSECLLMHSRVKLILILHALSLICERRLIRPVCCNYRWSSIFKHFKWIDCARVLWNSHLHISFYVFFNLHFNSTILKTTSKNLRECELFIELSICFKIRLCSLHLNCNN